MSGYRLHHIACHGFHPVQFHPKVTVDILERLPVPFGLVRFGAAPDHAGIKVNIHSDFVLVLHNYTCMYAINL